MNIILRQQQPLYVLRSLKRDIGAKLKNGLRRATFPLAAFLLATCALVSGEAKARPPADRDESIDFSSSEVSQAMAEIDRITFAPQETAQRRIAQPVGMSALAQANHTTQAVLDLIRER